jgi:hypothetical protein
MSPQPERFRLWRQAAPYVRAVVLSLLPVPDLLTRRRVRRTASALVTCDPWPGMDATDLDAAQLALLRLLWLQQQTRRAVRGRHREAAVMLARASIETLIVGLYCLHWEGAVAQLNAANAKAMEAMLEYLSDIGLIPADVLAECIRRLNLAEPARGPTIETMARRVDNATGACTAVDIYKQYYRPTSTLAVHANASSLLRHVRSDGHLTHRAGRMWNRRSPVRIADASAGLMAAAVAQRKGKPYQDLARYAERQAQRTLTPVVVMAGGGVGRMRPRQVLHTIRILRETGTYLWSGRAATDPVEVREAYIRDQFTAALGLVQADVPPGALDPFLDYISAQLAGETFGTA